MSETKAAVDGKGANGRFLPGNRFGCGNPYAREVARLREQAMLTLNENFVGDLFAKLYLMAMGGDLAALKLLLQYTVGKPVETAHPDRLDQDELNCFRANAAPSNVERDIQAASLEGTLPLMRVAKEIAAHQAREELARLTRPVAEESEQTAARSQRRNERPPTPPDDESDSEITEAEARALVNFIERKRREDDRPPANTGQR